MSELQQEAAEGPSTPPVGEDKKVWAERVLLDILRLMELPAKLDFKDAEDGSLSVAIHLETEAPGALPGKRSQWVDALQFLVNKIVNRPGVERRWVNLGVGGHPAPRGAKKEPPAPKPAPPAKGPLPHAKTNGAAPASPTPYSEPDERTLEVKEDKALTAAARALMKKSAQLGRFYALFGLKPEARARVVQAVKSTKGGSIRLEGEGRNRRVVFVPEAPTPMPKRTVPDYGEDEDEE